MTCLSAVVNIRSKAHAPRAYFTEVANDVTALVIPQSHDIEEKRLDIVAQRFVIQEQHGQQAEVLTVGFIFLAVHFPYG